MLSSEHSSDVIFTIVKTHTGFYESSSSKLRYTSIDRCWNTLTSSKPKDSQKLVKATN